MKSIAPHRASHIGRAVALLATLPAMLGIVSPAMAWQQPKIDFSRDVRPILSTACFPCHGPDAASRKGDFRLDRADAAFARTASGARALVAGEPEASEVIARIASSEPDYRMPPAASGRELTDKQKETLRLWVSQGARFDDHWAFRQPQPQQPPEVHGIEWLSNPIDNFVLDRLEKESVRPANRAARQTLLRRLSWDLRGLPPSPDEAREFAADESLGAYSRWVDRFLASPAFGERWGRHWLDLAHYADSDGYLGDTLRPHAWRYRDWVVRTINNDLPFDQFTVEQLAGDMLPSATIDQKTATGFLRNTMRNTEAGVDLEEYRLKEIVDRVNTIGNGWLGLSLGCAECHSHKYDPISQREFYQLFSFFNDADDVDLPSPQPGEQAAYEQQMIVWKRLDQQHLTKLDDLIAHATSPVTIDREMLVKACTTEARKRTAEQKKLLDGLAANKEDVFAAWTAEYLTFWPTRPTAPAAKVMTLAKRKEPRISYIHVRGDYRTRGENVQSGTPAVLPKLNTRTSEPDRLDFARWLVDRNNPLTARVTVNLIWKHLFGRGLVSTVDNFGVGGQAPSHPELLDWLACRFVDQGWSRKELIRLIVHSSTYQQSSQGRSELVGVDPENVLLARQSRFRVEAESLRDAALTASGLLDRTFGGPGIFPPQPAYIASISRNVEWKTSQGGDLYRRGLYILFRRATPYPMLMTFDAPDSSIVCTQRERSNSPLQALTLLNDPVFYDCARALGSDLLQQAQSHPAWERVLDEACLRCLGRTPSGLERSRLRQIFEESLAGHSDEHSDQPQLVAWTAVARVLLNLDEFLTRE